jgi:hypothetical protein
LQKRSATAQLAALIGASEAILLKQYAQFVKSRQDRLSRILQEGSPKSQAENLNNMVLARP